MPIAADVDVSAVFVADGVVGVTIVTYVTNSSIVPREAITNTSVGSRVHCSGQIIARCECIAAVVET